MATLLKQSTAVDIGVGPFVDSVDGFTPETGLTITQPDIRLKKNGGAWAQKNAAQTLTHEENGWYEVALDTTDADTLGILLVAIYESGALPVWREFMVVPANVYDSVISGSDKLDVNVEEWNATAVPAEDTAGYPKVTIKDGSGTGELDTASGKVSIATGGIVAATFGAGAVDAAAIAADAGTEIGTAVWATTTRALTDKAGFSLSAGGVQAIWDALTSALTTVGSIGKLLVDNINATISSRMATFVYTAPLDATATRAAVGLGSANLDTQLTAIDDLLDTEVADIKAKTDQLVFTGSRIDSSVGAVQANAIADAGVSTDLDTYQAKVDIVDDNTNSIDRYVVCWFKNSQPVLASITVPTIQVWKASDGSDLIASTAMTEIGTTETYRYDASTTERIVDGAAYVAKVEATIDGATRTWVQVVGRDS